MNEELNIGQPEREIINQQMSIYDIMSELKGVTFISLDSTTPVDLNKGYVDEDGERQPNPHYGRVTKVMKNARGMIFQNKNVNGYENQVRSGMAKEGIKGEFNVGPRKWGVREKDLPIVTHIGKVYLEIIFSYKGEVEYLLDGKPINESEILGVKKKSKPTGQGGIQKQIVIRTINVDHLDNIRAFGKQFTNITK